MLGDLVGDVRIEGTKIAEIGPDLHTATSDEVIIVDAAGMIVIPGFGRSCGFATSTSVDTVFVAGSSANGAGLVGHDLTKIQGTVENSPDYLLSAQVTCDPFAEGGSKPLNN